jgi:hypothetical protein
VGALRIAVLVHACRLSSRYGDTTDFFVQRAGSDDGVADSLLKDSQP